MRPRFVFQHLFFSQCSCAIDVRFKEKSVACCHPLDTLSLVVFGVFLFSPCLDMCHGSGDSLVWWWIIFT